MKALLRFPYWQEVVLMALLLSLFAWAKSLAPDFVTLDTQKELASQSWSVALLALPMLLIIVTGGIDLSVGSTVAMSAVALGLAYERGAPIAVAIVLACAVGTLLGAINGVFVAKLRVHPLIVTLATMAAFRGLATGISLGRPISGFPDGFKELATMPVLGIPLPGVVFVLLFALTAWVLGKTAFGRAVFTVGHNETAARFSGLPVDGVKLLLYTIAGTVAGIAAVFFVSLRNTAKADISVGLELDAITAVVLGGASINGGRGNVVGLLLGVVLIHETRQFVAWQWGDDNLINMVIGVLLVVSVLLHRVLSPKSRSEE